MQNPPEYNEKDINDIFSDILLSEENLNKQGFEEGYTKALLEGSTEGYHIGYHRGSEIGAELGYYHGIAENFLILLHKEQNDRKNEKLLKSLEKLKLLIDKFPKHNDEQVDILALADNIRILFKKVCAFLKIDSIYPESDKLTF